MILGVLRQNETVTTPSTSFTGANSFGKSGGGRRGRRLPKHKMAPSLPSSFLCGRTPRRDNDRTFRVVIPEGVQAREEFEVITPKNEVVRVICPPDKRAGDVITIKIPRLPQQPPLLFAEDDSPNVTHIENHDRDGMDAFLVEVPPDARPGEIFPVTIRGQRLNVNCPRGATPGMSVRVKRPPVEVVDPFFCDVDDDGAGDMYLFEVDLPPYARPGRPFALRAGGMHVMVYCPLNAVAGQGVRFRLPLSFFHVPESTSPIGARRLEYDKDGWSRTIRSTDEKFQWVRMDNEGGIDDRHLSADRFDPDKSAFCRTLQFVDSHDFRIRDGIFELVPAHKAECDSKVRDGWGGLVVTYADLAEAHGFSYDKKAAWFADKCQKLRVDWDSGHVKVNIRRKYLLEDSIDAVMSLSRRDMRKTWRFEFIGEEGIDAGGLAREWFYLVITEMFDPDKGFWLPSETNQMCMTINPSSRLILSGNLVYYRFLGRVMGKALFDGQLVAGHVAQFIYKHILGWPITFKDLRVYDDAYYTSLIQLRKLAENGEDVESILSLGFTTTVEMMGAKEDVELIENGADIAVTNDNYLEYMEACLKYYMMDRIRPQMKELLLGFFDVIDEPLLTVFDFQELELLMCGLPSIDLADWIQNTAYMGELENNGADHQACQWFWEIVYEFDQEMKARLLQFVTGTSGVPARGFGTLQGSDGSSRKFTINGVRADVCFYPRAHTCFNRLDMPLVGTKDELREKLVLAVTMAATGFDLE